MGNHANRTRRPIYTALHRAYMDKQAEEIMADDSVEVLKVVMSASHSRTRDHLSGMMRQTRR